MHITVVATDFDGTIAQDEQIDPDVARVLRRLRAAGTLTVLVSGRPFEFLHTLQDRTQAFDLIVAENGAVLYNPRTDEISLPFGEVPTDLIDALARLGVPLWRGIAAAGINARYDDAVWVASRELGLAVHIEANRSEVMLLPPGANKGAGLLNLLKSEGLSPRNLLAFGDAENDCSFLQMAEVKVAVANAVESLKAIADHVTPEAGPTGVVNFIERYLLDRGAFDFPVRGAHHFSIGEDGIHLNAHDLVNRNLLIAGGSGYGKSWLASRLADGLISGGYQLLVLDPVGDLRALRRHATCLCLGFGQEAMPPIDLVVQLLAETDLSLVVDLSHPPTPQEQVLYVAGLLRRMLEVHRRFGKPHWLLLDEAQDLLGGRDNPARLALLRGEGSPGVCLVTWRPSQLDGALVEQIDSFVLTRHRLNREVEYLSGLLADRGFDVTGLPVRLDALGEGQALIGGVTPSLANTLITLKFQVGSRVFPNMHNLYQHLEETVTPTKQFYFHDETAKTPPAGNLSEFIDRIEILDLSVVAYHFQRGDFSRWIRTVLHDETLARWLDRLQTTDLSGESLRQAMIEAFKQRHHALERLI